MHDDLCSYLILPSPVGFYLKMTLLNPLSPSQVLPQLCALHTASKGPYTIKQISLPRLPPFLHTGPKFERGQTSVLRTPESHLREPGIAFLRWSPKQLARYVS